MNLKEFYNFHGLSRVHFAKLVGIDYKSLMRYESGIEVKKETKLRIEIGMEIIEDWAIRYPRQGLPLSGQASRNYDAQFNYLFNRALSLENL